MLVCAQAMVSTTNNQVLQALRGIADAIMPT
jgi:hypothetical protein